MAEQTALETAQGVNKILKERIENYRNLAESLIQKSIELAGQAGGIRKEAMKDLLERGKAIFSIVENGSKIEPRNKDGVLICGQDMVSPIGIDEWVESLKTDAPHLWEPEGQARGQATGLEDQLDEAIKNKDLQLQIRLKRLISEARQKA